MMSRSLRAAILVLLGFSAGSEVAQAQSNGILRGTVTLENNGGPLHHASVLIVQLGRSTETREDGAYMFREVPPGKYEVVAHMHPLSDLRRPVEVAAGAEAALDFELRIAPVHEEITVTASEKELTSLEAFQSVLSLEHLDLATKSAASLGEALDTKRASPSGAPARAPAAPSPGASTATAC